MTKRLDDKLTKVSRAAAQECVGFSIRKAARAIARHYDEKLAPSNLKGTQFSVLNAVHLMSAPTVQKLAEALGMDRTTLTRNLKPLERDELLSVRPGKDQRSRVVMLTGEGAQRLAKALPLWREAQLQVASKLGDARKNRLVRDLGTVVQVTGDID